MGLFIISEKENVIDGIYVLFIRCPTFDTVMVNY